ncbi:MAG TPA: hypothetical protein VGD71_16725 [Kribbella sp.]|jgi:hypothetical protein
MSTEPAGRAQAGADLPSVLHDGVVWLVCPFNGYDCARVPRDQSGVQWAMDVISVHVALHHRRWDWSH